MSIAASVRSVNCAKCVGNQVWDNHIIVIIILFNGILYKYDTTDHVHDIAYTGQMGTYLAIQLIFASN